MDIDNLCAWSDDNLLKFNDRKCKYTIFSRRKQPSLPVTPLKIKQTCMERVHSYKYLKVWLTSILNWSMQVSKVCKRCKATSGYSVLKVLSLCKHFLTLIAVPGLHPSTSGVCSTWDSYQQGVINSLERVQKFALKVCTKSWSFGYESMFQSCNLPTLAIRRHYMKLCLLYQIVSGHLNFPAAPIVP